MWIIELIEAYEATESPERVEYLSLHFEGGVMFHKSEQH